MTTDVYVGGLPFSHTGVLQIVARPAGGVGTNVAKVRGIAVELAGGMVYVEDAGAAVPSTAFYMGGIALTADGAIYVTQSTSGTFYWNAGIKTRSDGAVAITNGTPVSGTWGELGAQGPDGGISIVGNGFAATLQTTIIPWLSSGSGTPTFTRATVAMVWGYGPTAVIADGPVLLTVASGEARFVGARRISEGVWSAVDANGVALTTTNGASALYGDADGPFGYLAEGARTNRLLQSQTLENVAWTASNMTVDDASAVGPTGASTATTLTATAANATIIQDLGTVASASKTGGIWIKRKTGTGNIDLTMDGGTGWTTQTVTAAWTRISKNQTLADEDFGIRIVTSGDEVYVWNGQVETAAFLSSDIATTTGAVTRNGDLLKYPSASNVSGVVGTLYHEVVKPNGNDGYATGFNIANIRTVSRLTATTIFAADGSGTLGIGSFTPSASVQKIAVSWDGTNLQYVNGGAAGTPVAYDGDLNVTDILIGAEGNAITAALFGTIRNVRIYPTALPASTLQTLTT